MIYLDNAATTPLSDEVREYFLELNTSVYGNPSSLHSLGREAKKLLDNSRKILAEKINADPEEIVFVNSATEANNLAIFGLKNEYDVIITTPMEHPSVLEPVKSTGIRTIYLDLDSEGFIDLKELERHLEREPKALVSVIHGNNEIGTIQNLEAIGKLCKEYAAIFHTDAVQTFCKLPIDVKKYNLDLLSVSAHKIHGPKGVGFLYKKKDLEIEPLISGGGQERNLRSGTENVNSIAAMAKAVETYGDVKKINELHKFLSNELLKIDGVTLNGSKDLKKRVPGNINISVPKFKSEQMMLQLDLAGVFVGTGSACSSAKGDPSIQSSYVLRACCVPDSQAQSAIRLSISKLNTKDEILKAIDSVKKILG